MLKRKLFSKKQCFLENELQYRQISYIFALILKNKALSALTNSTQTT